MKHTRDPSAQFTLGFVASLAAIVPASGAGVPSTDEVISTNANGAWSVFAKDVDGDIDVLSASWFAIPSLAWGYPDCCE